MTQILGEHVILTECRLETHYGPLLYDLLLRTVVSYMVPFRNFKNSKNLKFAVPSWKNYFENESELSKICSPIRIWMGSY